LPSTAIRQGTPAVPIRAASYAFLDFELVPRKRALYFRQQRVDLGSRAYDVLLALVERAGQLVGKEELIAIVWPDTIVEEGNLRVQISALRKALREEHYGLPCIESIARCGYIFSAGVQRRDGATAAPAAAQARCDAPVGRDEDIAAIGALLLRRRFVTLTGAAGAGKSVAAATLAQRLGQPYALVAAGPDADPGAALRAIGIDWPRPSETARGVLLLDDCDQDIHAARALVTRLRAALPDVMLLATSREALGVEGETVYRLAPLALPPHGAALTPAQAYAYPAVRLFCERTRALCRTFTIGARDVDAIVAICRELDGIPLALELAAQNMELFTPQELLTRMQDRFQVLTTVRRCPLPRHQSMWAALEWGFARLAVRERIVLQRLALFRSAFSHGGAATLVCCEFISATDLAAILPRLVDIALLEAELQDGYIGYRMPNTLRAFALCKLHASDDPLFRPGRDHPLPPHA
jgi:predicted ATPase/DNA-binding winged helix-turn-helix (wHTH) protein